MSVLLLLTLAPPLVLFIALSVLSLLGQPASERTTGRLVSAAQLVSLAAAVGLALTWRGRVDVSLGRMVVIEGYAFEFRLMVDGLSLTYLILTLLLSGVTGLFAHRYLHREPGFNRFFVLYALFVVGLQFSALAGSMETLVAAWELVGVASVMLVGFFHERPEPIRNALRVWAIYRIGDLALILAGCLAHHWTGSGSFDVVFASGHASLGLLLLIAAMGKSALVPFSSWLPRAMEGPTPSSAIFYGALSVHLGAFLLLRASELLDAHPWVSWLVVAVGLTTALHGTFVGHVQTDIKCALAYASMTQVGIIFVEIGLGGRVIPLVHLAGHACLRTLQFLRAPSLLHDLHRVENAIGSHLPRTGLHFERWFPAALRSRLYRVALERGYLEAILRDIVTRPFLWIAERLDRVERAWIRLLEGSEK
jgi:NAD(P)H-quinone oxidoreductase subunit 5